jgi:peroxiredoxin
MIPPFRRSRMAVGTSLLILVTAAAGTSHAQSSSVAPAVDVQALGPQVGQRLPDFRLPDQRGQERTLQSLLGQNGAVIVFFRSADWCPYCKTQLVELEGSLPEVHKAGLGLVAISYDPVSVLADFSTRRGITFPLLSDAGSATIKRYGILNTTIDPKNELYGYPFPGTFIVDRRGMITSRVFEAAYQERTTMASIVVRSGRHVDMPATKFSAAHVDGTSYATDQVAVPGTHFSLVLDIAPAAKVHVYAPGASGYNPVALRLTPQPGLIVKTTTFPASEDYLFKPLNEHVPVYQHPFQIVQDVMLDPSKEGSLALKDLTSVTITGTFEYQACDDRVCYVPQSVPLSWTVVVKPLDLERAKRP